VAYAGRYERKKGEVEERGDEVVFWYDGHVLTEWDACVAATFYELGLKASEEE